MNLARLFEPLPKPRSLSAELDAVADGTKRLSYFASSRDVVEDGSDLIPIMRGAFKRGLTVSLTPRGELVDIVVHAPATKIDKLLAFVARTKKWSWAAEEKQGILLGYSAKERAAHIAQLRESRLGFGFITAYAINEGEAPRLGDKVFFPREPMRVSPRALKHVPPGKRLVRFGIAPVAVRGGKVVTTTFTKRITPVEILGARGWD